MDVELFSMAEVAVFRNTRSHGFLELTGARFFS